MPDLAITALDVLLDVLQVLNLGISTGVTPQFVQPQGEISALLPWPQSPWGSSMVSALPVDPLVTMILQLVHKRKLFTK